MAFLAELRVRMIEVTMTGDGEDCFLGGDAVLRVLLPRSDVHTTANIQLIEI